MAERFPDYCGPEERKICWRFALGDWVRCQNFTREAVFVIVWREYRDTPWTERHRYGLLPISDLDLDPMRGEKAFDIEIGEESDLTPYDGDEDGQQYEALAVKLRERRHG